MTVKGVRLKSESFFAISHGILELWRKTLGGGFSPPRGMDRVNKSDGESDTKNFTFFRAVWDLTSVSPVSLFEN